LADPGNPRAEISTVTRGDLAGKKERKLFPEKKVTSQKDWKEGREDFLGRKMPGRRASIRMLLKRLGGERGKWGKEGTRKGDGRHHRSIPVWGGVRAEKKRKDCNQRPAL